MSLPQTGQNAPNHDQSHSDITVSPFYHSAVNSVTEPGRFVGCSLYFVQRWMPLLGNEGVRIVLALRALGYYNPKTGVRRDSIPIDKAELADRCGCSERTIARELADDPATGKPRNWALAQFVQRRTVQRRNKHTGRVWQEANEYQVAMDDPIHPDDWPRVAEYVAQREAQQPGNKGKEPGGQNGRPGIDPDGQNGTPGGQSVTDSGQIVPPDGQNGSPPKSFYSDLPRESASTPPAVGGSLTLFQDQPRPVAAAERILAASDSPFAKALRKKRGKPE